MRRSRESLRGRRGVGVGHLLRARHHDGVVDAARHRHVPPPQRGATGAAARLHRRRLHRLEPGGVRQQRTKMLLRREHARHHVTHIERLRLAGVQARVLPRRWGASRTRKRACARISASHAKRGGACPRTRGGELARASAHTSIAARIAAPPMSATVASFLRVTFTTPCPARYTGFGPAVEKARAPMRVSGVRIMSARGVVGSPSTVASQDSRPRGSRCARAARSGSVWLVPSLVEALSLNPYYGLEKPEALRFKKPAALPGRWLQACEQLRT